MSLTKTYSGATCNESGDKMLSSFLNFIMSHSQFDANAKSIATLALTNKRITNAKAVTLIADYINYHVTYKSYCKGLTTTHINRIETIIKNSGASNNRKSIDINSFTPIFSQIINYNNPAPPILIIDRNTFTFNDLKPSQLAISVATGATSYHVRSNAPVKHTATAAKQTGFLTPLNPEIPHSITSFIGTNGQTFKLCLPQSDYTSFFTTVSAGNISHGTNIKIFKTICSNNCSLCGNPIHIYCIFSNVSPVTAGMLKQVSYTNCGEIDHTIPPSIGNFVGSLEYTSAGTIVNVNTGITVTRLGLGDSHFSCNQAKGQQNFLDEECGINDITINDFSINLVNNLDNDLNQLTSAHTVNFDMIFLKKLIDTPVKQNSFKTSCVSHIKNRIQPIADNVKSILYNVKNEIVFKIRATCFTIDTALRIVITNKLGGGSPTVMMGGATPEEFVNHYFTRKRVNYDDDFKLLFDNYICDKDISVLKSAELGDIDHGTIPEVLESVELFTGVDTNSLTKDEAIFLENNGISYENQNPFIKEIDNFEISWKQNKYLPKENLKSVEKSVESRLEQFKNTDWVKKKYNLQQIAYLTMD